AQGHRADLRRVRSARLADDELLGELPDPATAHHRRGDCSQRPRDPPRGVRPRRSRGLVETVAFLEALVRGLGRGWSARYGIIAPYGVLGLTLTSDAGGTGEIIPSRGRREVGTWSPVVVTPGTPRHRGDTDA